MSNRISREKLVEIYGIEINFFNALQDSGLVKTESENQITYLLFEELPAFEKFTNWHYDLEVNLAGLEVLNHLLQKIDDLQAENRRLNRTVNLESF
ncbi:chaperone modulator CbpM [Chryseobacterium sp. MP_3.2]|uniref:chaperone modulator CbpM n=1 Tax=Chryseobacterium sp. MP_3.2 TaxID=3071712 RepID=UPI002DF8D2F0|nr:chaperone modulatory protein CbpM [Chryseobacterium sp. MP_3.2]